MTELSPTHCPLCTQPNHCALAHNQLSTSCWCQHVKFDQHLLDQIPNKHGCKACICQSCAELSPPATSKDL